MPELLSTLEVLQLADCSIDSLRLWQRRGTFPRPSHKCGRAAEHTLQWFTAGQPMLFEEKGRDPFTAIPTARLMVACNAFPRVADKSEGVWRRMLLLPFTRTITADRRVLGADQPAWWRENANLAGVLGWALDGLRRLRERGTFTKPRSSEAGKAELRDESNPVRMFFEDFVVLGGWIAAPELYQRYRQWGVDGGMQPLSAIAFGREVKRFHPSAESQVKRFGNRVQRVWDGIQWRTETIEIPDWLLAFPSGESVSIVETDFDFDSWSEEDANREALADDLLAIG
jgi:phage/plasmid-associated DNA primase